MCKRKGIMEICACYYKNINAQNVIRCVKIWKSRVNIILMLRPVTTNCAYNDTYARILYIKYMWQQIAGEVLHQMKYKYKL